MDAAGARAQFRERLGELLAGPLERRPGLRGVSQLSRGDPQVGRERHQPLLSPSCVALEPAALAVALRQPRRRDLLQLHLLVDDA